MKTRFLRIGKSSLSLTLSLMMIATTVFFGSFGTADAITTSDTASVDVVEDAVADINVDVEEADDAFAETNAIDERVSADAAAEDTVVDDKSVTVDSNSVRTSVTTTNTTTKKTEKKTPEASGTGNIIYFNPPSGWLLKPTERSIRANYFGGSNGSSWPGTKMTYDSTTGYYMIDVGDNTNVQFTNVKDSVNSVIYRHPATGEGSYSVIDGMVYDFTGNVNNKIYFEKPSSWGAPKAYYYDNVADTNSIQWENSPSMDLEGSDIYSIEISSKYRRVIFTDGSNQYPSSNSPGCLIYQNGYYTTSGYQGTYSSSSAPFHFLYGTSNDPRTFTNELDVQSDDNGYYVELPTDAGVNYYFGISSASSSSSDAYKSLYVQRTQGADNYNDINTNINVTVAEGTTGVSTQSNINYNITTNDVATEYYCSRVKSESSSVSSVKIYINTDYGHSYTVSAENSAETSGTVTVIAKTGTIRDNFDKYCRLAVFKDDNIADGDTSFVYTDTNTPAGTNVTNHWFYTEAESSMPRVRAYGEVQRNREVEFKIHVKSAYKTKYYVKAFCVNGETYGLTDTPDTTSGDYSCKFTIDDDDEGPIEITPIYYYVESNSDDYVTLAVEDFTGEVKSLWGNTIACYAYYVGGTENAANSADYDNQNALGGYPGQPMVYINGSYYMQLPKKITSGATIEGITLNNYVWDEVHARKLNGVSMRATGTDNTGIDSISDDKKKAKNCQTYDYDDFSALRETRSASRIIFNFKYRTYNNNDSTTDKPSIGNVPQATTMDLSYVNTNGNGWDALTDYYDVPVDLFSRRIVDNNNEYLTDTYVKGLGTNSSSDVVYVVSDGYVAYYSHADNNGIDNGSKDNKYLGQYGTRWYVYKKSGSSYNYIGALPPSAFLTGLTKDGDSANAKTYTEGDNAYTESNFLNYAGALAANKVNGENYNAYSTWSDYEVIYQACAGLPVVITYESNIYSTGADGVERTTGTGSYNTATTPGNYSYSTANYAGTTQNPGYRCDGRWYYSKANQIIKGTTKIKIIKKDSSGNIVTDSDGNIDYQDDPYSENSNVGGTTGASAYFTNKTTDAYGNSYYGLTSTSVYEDEEDDFTVKASANSSGSYTFDGDSSESDVIFKFVGWYLETGSGLLNPISTDVTGSRQMDSTANFVAVYEPVKVTERSLFIEHELYADLYDSLSSKTGVTAPKNGTGTPYIDSVVITKNNETLYSNKTKVNGSVIVINDSTALVDGATVTVTLSATPANSETTYEGVYIPGTTSGYVENSADGTKASGVTLPNGTTTTYTYTYTISDSLFTDNKATLSHYSEFSTTLLSVNFKYYDRVTSADSHTETISTTASTVAISASATISGNSSIENAIANGLGTSSYNSTTGTNTSMSTLKNLIDEYYFWTSTNEAVTGIKALPNYHAKNTSADSKTDITSYYSTKYGNGDYSDEVLANHLDCYGVPNGGLADKSKDNAADYSAEAWVTYTKTDGTTVTYTSQNDFANGEDTLSNVKSVTVWGYNAPRTYTVSLYKPTDCNSFETVNNSVYYTKTTGVTPSTVTAFYNQRLAGEDKNYTGSNSASAYLGEYGISGYFGDDSAVTADKEITLSDSTKVVFDGWYDSTTHTKISSDRKYGYRVTTDLSLVAGYKTSKTDGTKVSITNNGVEPFIDANNQSRVRLTTVVNVYDNLDTDANSENYLNPKDKDDSIKKVSAIYVQLPVKDSDGNKIMWNSDNLAALKLDSTTEGIGKAVRDYLVSSDFTSNTEVKNSDTLTITIDVSSVTFGVETTSTENQVGYGEVTEKIISYTYDVTFDSDDIDANTTMLTNKNRVQFTLPMKAELYYGTGDVAGSNSAIIAYAAIYYDTTDNDTADGSWIVSENHAEFIAPVVAGNSGL